MQRLGPGRRAKHLKVQTLWVQQSAKIGLISLNKSNTLENVADLLGKHVPRAVIDKLAGMMGYAFLGEETTKFQACTSINQNTGIRELQQVRNCGSSKGQESQRLLFGWRDRDGQELKKGKVWT